MRSAAANRHLPAIRGDGAAQDRSPPAQLATGLSGSEPVLEATKTRQDEVARLHDMLQKKDAQLVDMLQKKDEQLAKKDGQLERSADKYQAMLQKKDEQLAAQLAKKDEQLAAQLAKKDEQLAKKDEQLERMLGTLRQEHREDMNRGLSAGRSHSVAMSGPPQPWVQLHPTPPEKKPLL